MQDDLYRHGLKLPLYHRRVQSNYLPPAAIQVTKPGGFLPPPHRALELLEPEQQILMIAMVSWHLLVALHPVTTGTNWPQLLPLHSSQPILQMLT